MDPQHTHQDTEPFVLDEQKSSGRLLVTENERLLGGSAYISQIILPAVLPVILLATDETQNSAFLRYHAVQSLALLVASIIYYLAAAMVYIIVVAILPLLACIAWVPFLVPTVALAYFGIAAIRGQLVQVPWLTDLLKKKGLV